MQKIGRYNTKKPKRPDALYDIKIPVTSTQKKNLRMVSYQISETVTHFTTSLLKKALEYPYDLPEINYKDTKLYVHARVTQKDYDRIQRYAIEWGTSVRKAAHRMFALMYHFNVKLR